MSSVQFRKLRLSLGLTQDEMARFIGVTTITVSRWERDTTRWQPAGISRTISEILRDAISHSGVAKTRKVVKEIFHRKHSEVLWDVMVLANKESRK